MLVPPNIRLLLVLITFLSHACVWDQKLGQRSAQPKQSCNEVDSLDKAHIYIYICIFNSVNPSCIIKYWNVLEIKQFQQNSLLFQDLKGMHKDLINGYIIVFELFHLKKYFVASEVACKLKVKPRFPDW